METLVIVHPTLKEYHERVSAMAVKYGKANWFELSPDDMAPEDSFDYTFIVSAVGDQLINREFLEMRGSPENREQFICKNDDEPGQVPGSLLLVGVTIGRPRVCGAH
jgi:hypothetical protein